MHMSHESMHMRRVEARQLAVAPAQYTSAVVYTSTNQSSQQSMSA